MIELDLDAIEARHAATTPGTWTAHSASESPDPGYAESPTVFGPDGYPLVGGWDATNGDVSFIAAAHNADVPDLLAEVRALRQQVAELKHQLNAESDVQAMQRDRIAWLETGAPDCLSR